MSRSLCAALTFVCCAPPTTALAQERRANLDVETSCEGCEVRFSVLAALGSVEDSVLISDFSSGLVVLPGDTIAVGVGMFEEGVLIFSRDGHLVRRLGRSGQGPGEVLGVQGLQHFVADSLLVVGRDRILVMASDGEVARQRQIALRVASALASSSDGLTVYSFPEVRNGLRDARFSLFDRSLRTIRRFGDVQSSELRTCSICRARVVAWGRDGESFWAIPTRAPVLEHWSSDGRLQSAIRLTDPQHFSGLAESEAESAANQDEPLRPGRRRPTLRPAARVTGLQADGNGTLWVTILEPARDWKPYPGGVPSVPPSEYPKAYQEWRASQWDTRIVGIEAGSGRVVGFARFARRQVMPTNDFHYFERRQSDLGVISYDVLRLSVIR
jgi:hypothetical protein